MSKHTSNPRTKSDNQGEGNREAAEAYNEAQQAFVREGKVEDKADERRGMSDRERREAERAEHAGESRAREKDPNVVRDYHRQND